MNDGVLVGSPGLDLPEGTNPWHIWLLGASLLGRLVAKPVELL